jgi:class 3 adenylate cyclase
MRAVQNQRICGLVFTDTVGYTRLPETAMPAFVSEFLGGLARIIDRHPRNPLSRNTWGDALFLVYEDLEDAGQVALKMRDWVQAAQWRHPALPRDLTLRIALHAGPVFEAYDPVRDSNTFSGVHVSRAARIEPIVDEGQIFASEEFAALAAAAGITSFSCQYIGRKDFAKGYGSFPVYLVRSGQAV